MLERNGLHFTPDGNGYVCQEMVNYPAAFAARWTPGETEAALKFYFEAVIAMAIQADDSTGEADRLSREERRRLGQEMVREVVDEITSSKEFTSMTRFERLCFTLSQWWFFHPALMEKVFFPDDEVINLTTAMGTRYFVPALPEAVASVVANKTFKSIAVSGGHFAMLFSSLENDAPKHVRFIVTDARLFRVEDARGYIYLDILESGMPVVRHVTQLGGGRAFFDGVRLMTHENFQTCAPRVVAVEGGYKVNSTKCTIINGVLYPLVDEGNAVAHTTGHKGWLCPEEFLKGEHAAGMRIDGESAKRITFNEGVAILDGKELRPLGRFLPSETHLGEDGFTTYFPSVYEPA